MSNKLFVVLVHFVLCSSVFSQNTTNETKFGFDTTGESSKYVFIPFLLIISAIIRHVVKSYGVPIPYPVFCILFGFMCGCGSYYDKEWMQKVINATHSPEIDRNLIHVVTPVIIFTTAFCTEFHTLMKSLLQIVIISFPVALLCGITTGKFMKLVIDPKGDKWEENEALIFGILTLPVYPVYIIQCLKEASIQTKYVMTMLQGETLLSTTISLFVFNVLIGSLDKFVHKWNHYVMLTVRALICSVPVSYIFGLLGCCFMKYVYNDSTILILLSLSICFTSYYAVEWMCSAGPMGPMIVGIMMGSNRHYLPKENENNFLDFWKIMSYLVNDYIFFIVGEMSCPVLFQGSLDAKLDAKAKVLIFVTFLASNIVRFTLFFIFSPILSRTGYGMTFKTMFVCFWSGLKSPVSLSLVLNMLQFGTEKKKDEAIFFIHIVGVHFLFLLINGTCIKIILKMLALWEISASRQITMNNCMKYIYEARTRNIAILKMDRFLSDANWPLVMSITALKHPYRKMDSVEDLEGENEDEDFFLGYRYTFCPDCQKHILNEPTPKQMKEMTQEAKSRILKLKKTTYSRQYENGMISRDGIRLLHQAVEVAMDTDEQIIVLDGLFKLFTKENSVYRYIQHQLQEILQSKEVYKIPRRKWMLWCFKIVNHYGFSIFINCIILLHITVNCLRLLNSDKGKSYEIPKLVFPAFVSVFCIVYYGQLLMKIFGYTINYLCREGLKTYFTSGWDLLDFVIFLTTVVAVVFLSLEMNPNKKSSENYEKTVPPVIWAQTVLLTLRALKIITFLKFFTFLKPVPLSILKYLDTKTSSNKIMAFELATNFIIGEEEILDNLPLIVDNEKLRKSIKEQTENDRSAVCRQVGITQKLNPWFTSTAKTKACIRAVLNSLKDDIQELKSSGWVDDLEYYRLMNSLAERYKHLSTIRLIEPTPPEMIFKTLPLMGNDDILIEFLYKNVCTKKYDPGSTVLEQGVPASGIYILVTGLFRVNYSPNESTINKLREAGIIPVVDLTSATYDEPVKEYILPGASLGEHSTLTGRLYDGSVIAETHSEVYFLKAEVIKKAISSDMNQINGLESRLWKTISFRTAVNIMMNIPSYRTSNKENIKYFVERSFVPDLSNYKVFVINAMMQDVILIEGIAVDSNTREIYTAPFYIPKGVERLILPRSSGINIDVVVETKLMIIPAKDYDEYDVMVEEEETCELVSKDSSRCLRHLIQASNISAGTVKSTEKGGVMSAIARELRKAFRRSNTSISKKRKTTIV